MVELGEVCDVRDGTHESPKYVLEGYPLITSKNLKNGFIEFTDVNLISREDLDAINKRSNVDAGDILMPMIGTIGNPVIADATREYAVKNVALIKFSKDSKIDNRFLKDVLASVEMQSKFELQASGSTQRFIPLVFIRSLRIPLPPLATQQAIVAEIEAEQALVAANRELIARFEKKIQAILARIWGEDEPSPAELCES
jgi:restriction endonuclease S subunit